MKRFMDGVVALFRRLFSRDMWSRFLRGVEAAAPYLDVAYEVVEFAAKMTPNRTDDELLALAQALGVPAVWKAEDKGGAIRQLVAAALKAKWPDLPDHTINRIIEMAYGALRP